LAVIVSIETAMGVLHAEEIAAASDRVCALMVNTTNLGDSLHAKATAQRSGLATSFGLVILAARAYGKAVIDGPHTDIRDAQSCEFSCRQGRDFGFDGKAVIHPVQLPYTNDAFTPNPKEVEKAQAIIAAMEAEHARPYTLLDGQLLEPVELQAARRCIALHKAIAERQGAFPGLAAAG
jgi:citrate lyase subunit beta/citryl-CoA lyase